MMRKAILISLIALFILSSIAYGEDFNAYATSKTIEMCQCTTASNTITIQNENPLSQQLTISINDDTLEREETSDFVTIPSFYSISQEGKASAWSTLFPAKLTVEGGKTEEIDNFITAPCNALGKYDLQTNIKTSLGLEKIISQEIKVNECDNFDITVISAEATGCPCTTLQWEIKIKNTGQYKDDFLIGTSKDFKSFITLSDNPVTLNPGEAKTVFVFMNGPCSTYGNLSIPIKVKSEKNNLIKQDRLEAGISSCYDYDLTTGELIRYYDDSEDYFKEFSGNYDICEKEPYGRIPVRITNKADIPTDYYLKIKGPKWAKLEYNEFQNIGKDEYAETFLVLDPYANLDGDYPITLTVTTAVANIDQTFKIPIFAGPCFTPKLAQNLKKIKVNYSILSTPLKLTNKGSKESTYDLSINLDWAEISPPTLTLGSNESGSVKLISYPNDQIPEGTYKSVITITPQENGVSYTKKLSIIVSKGEFLSLFGIASSYVIYLIIGLVILIIIIILLIFLGKKKPDDKKDTQEDKLIDKPEEKTETKTKKQQLKAEKTAEKAEKTVAEESIQKKHSWKWLVIIIAVLIIITALYFGYLYLYPIVSEKLAGNETTILEPTSPQENTSITKYAEPVKQFLILYKWYLLIGIIIAIAIILLLSIKKKPKEKKIVNKPAAQKVTITHKKAKTKPIKPAPKKVKTVPKKVKKSMGWWLALVLILICVILVLAAYYAYTLNSQRTLMNETSAIEETAINFTGIDCLKTWPKNTPTTLDLSQGFKDPDGDPLTFTTNEPDHITIEIDENGIATLTPENDYSGVIDVEFYADDGRGFFVPTGNLSLCITDENPDLLSRSWQILTKYRKYLLIGAVILVLILLLLIYNKPIIKFLEEDEEPRK